MIVSSRDYAPRIAGTNQPFEFYSSGRGIGFGPNGSMMCADQYWSTYYGFGVYLSYDLGKSWLNRVTAPTPGFGTYTDTRDGKIYKTVLMPDGKWWAAENMAWAGAGVDYDNNPTNRATYGRLYTWTEAMAVCPTGTHLPTDAEWTAMGTACGTPSTLGLRLKASSGWSGFGSGTDIYGFHALPSGYRSEAGLFTELGNSCWWHSATEGTNASRDAWSRILISSYDTMLRQESFKTTAFSVRFIVDSGNSPQTGFAPYTPLGGCAYGKITNTQMGWAVTAPGYGVAYFIDTPSNYDTNGFPKPETWQLATGTISYSFVDLIFDANDDYWYCTPASSYILRRRRLDSGNWELVYPPVDSICGGQASKGNGEAVVVDRDSGSVCYTPNLAAATPTWTKVAGVLDTFDPSEGWSSVAYADGLWIFVGYVVGTTVYCTDPLNPTTYKQAWGPGNYSSLYTIATNGTLWLATTGQGNNPSIVEITVDARDNAVLGSLPPGTYKGVQLVVLTPIFGNEVRYTLDGSIPTLSSPLYTGPLRITASTTIKAVAVYDGEISPITELVYIVTNADIVPLDYKASIMPLLIHQYQKDLV
jgi:uncharacterized protein (TIGR02145 family)